MPEEYDRIPYEYNYEKEECKYWRRFTGHWEKNEEGMWQFIIDMEWFEWDCY